jgi:glyoxylase-like metal-dependent hydrolase (beta-lactamase superfamily II)
VEGVYRFSLGPITCTVLSDGERKLRGGWFSFANASAAEVDAVWRAYSDATGDPADNVGVNLLLIDTGTVMALVDTGNGPGDGEDGELLERLADTDYTPEDIDLVIITHAHGDHIQANTNADGTPTFPNATYVISAPEWDHWTREPSDTVLANLIGIEDRVRRVAPDAEIAPGIQAVPAPGHTPGQIALLIGTGADRLLHVADAFHHPVELARPEWYFSFDHDAEQTVRTRRELLDLAARANLLVLPYHFGFPGLGRVVADGDAWIWRKEPAG